MLISYPIGLLTQLTGKIVTMPFNLPEPAHKRDYVRLMFARIAPSYDLMNRIMTFGQDSRWRRRVIDILQPKEGKLYLDAGAGTGDLSQLIINATPSSTVFAIDLTYEMIEQGKACHTNKKIIWIQADTQYLPFENGVFEGVVSGYVYRNVTDIDKAITEHVRVSKSAGKIICLDSTPPSKNLLYPFILLYLKWIMPLIGRLVTGDSQAYRYLSLSTSRHLSAQEMAERMEQNGCANIQFEKWMAGTIAIHSGSKP